MLGSNLALAFPAEGFKVFSSHIKLNWENRTELFSQLKELVINFANEAAKHRRWTIFWAAGKSNMLSSDLEISNENDIFNFLLQCLKDQNIFALSGVFAIASSAGGIYADSRLPIVTESSPVFPNSPYARGKLFQEELLINLSRAYPHIGVAIFRISTLYGFRASGFSRQGLIGAISQKIQNHEEIEFFVPLSTRRDFIHVEDASLLIAKILKNIGINPGIFIKIISSERTHSIEEVLNIFRKKVNGPIRFNCTLNKASLIYNRNFEFRSNTFIDVKDIKIRGLEEGIENLLCHLSIE